MAQFERLVLDANAIISAGAVGLYGVAEKYYSVQEALNEVRDTKARQVLDTLPFPVETRIPADSSVAAVREFAKRTGDLSRLSKTDILLLALAHQLERELNGAAHIRSEPPKVVSRMGLRSAAPAATATERPLCRFFSTQTGCRNGSECRFSHDAARAAPAAAGGGSSAASGGDAEAPASSAAAGAGGAGSDGITASPAASDLHSSSAASSVPAVVATGSAATLLASVPPVTARAPADTAAGSATPAGPTPAPMGQSDRLAFGEEVVTLLANASLADDGDGEGAWITPTRGSGAAAAAAPAAAATAAASAAGPARRLVASMTTDFAMQNVLLQMGLLLSSPQGKQVQSVKSWVMKCDACFTITEAMDKLFCPRCGNATLARLGVTLAADGTPRYHYKTNRVIPTRGTQYALPAPQGGRGGDLLLREDQLLTGYWAQKARLRETHEPMFAERQAGGAAAGAFGSGAGSGVSGAGAIPSADRRRGGLPSLGADSGIAVGLGRRNPNEAHRRK